MDAAGASSHARATVAAADAAAAGRGLEQEALPSLSTVVVHDMRITVLVRAAAATPIALPCLVWQPTSALFVHTRHQESLACNKCQATRMS